MVLNLQIDDKISVYHASNDFMSMQQEYQTHVTETELQNQNKKIKFQNKKIKFKNNIQKGNSRINKEIQILDVETYQGNYFKVQIIEWSITPNKVKTYPFFIYIYIQ